MKQILMALAITVATCIGAQAQTGCKIAHKHTVHKYAAAHHAQKLSGVLVSTRVCRLLPYEVCTINADRRTVSCFKTVDPNALQPMNDQTTVYGPTGAMPGQVEQPAITTIVIKGETPGNRCIRDDANKATICYQAGGGIIRDENGFYHYR
jgi:hypothetical protein